MTDVPTTTRKAMSQTRRLRIWEDGKGICILCKRQIDGVREAWIVEHKIALGLGGADTDDNCGPAHEGCRRVKDKIDVPAIAKAKRMKMRHVGIKKRSSFPKPPPGYRYDWGQRRFSEGASMKKSYWMGVTTQTERQRQAVLSWFSGVCDGMTVEKAEVLCDSETDREKKIKAVVVDADGKRHLATRTVGKNYTITLARVRP